MVGRRSYEQVAADDEPAEPVQSGSTAVEAPRGPSGPPGRRYSRVSLDEGDTQAPEPLEEADDGSRVTITILDFAHNKFTLSVNPSWSIQTLKLKGQEVHKVVPERQRLVYQGRLLQDEVSLADSGIAADGLIVHLFPKPRVVIKDEQSESEEAEEGSPEGARVPTIVLDSNEAQQRSSILVLGSTEYMETQNNVKMFSFMLMIVSSIELMTLLSIALGAPQSEAGLPLPEDDIFPSADDAFSNHTSPDDSGIYYEHWQTRHWFDLLISALGVYVAMLGIQASSQSTLRMARQYMWGLVVVAIGWLLYNFVLTYKIDEEVEHAKQEAHEDDALAPATDKDILQDSLTMMILPAMVWFMCIARAWQLQHLLQDAEQEAEERIRSQLDDELALQQENASIV